MQLDTPSGPKVMLHIKPGWSAMAANGDSLRINPFGVGRGLQVLPGSFETALSVSGSLAQGVEASQICHPVHCTTLAVAFHKGN